MAEGRSSVNLKPAVDSPSLHDLAQTCQEISSLLESVHQKEKTLSKSHDITKKMNLDTDVHSVPMTAKGDSGLSAGQVNPGDTLLEPETQVIQNTDKLSQIKPGTSVANSSQSDSEKSLSTDHVNHALEVTSAPKNQVSTSVGSDQQTVPVSIIAQEPMETEPRVAESQVASTPGSTPRQVNPVSSMVSVISADHAAAENDNNLNMLYASRALNLVNAGNASVIVLQACEGAENVVLSNLFAAQEAVEKGLPESSSDIIPEQAELHAVELHVAEDAASCSTNTDDQSSVLETQPVINSQFGSTINLEGGSLQGELYIESASGPLLLQVVTEESETTRSAQGGKPDCTKTGSVSETSVVTQILGQEEKLQNQRERPFKCDLCSATFTRLGNYTRHRMIHTVKTKEDYRYKCEQCARMFLQRCDLKRHLQIHNGTEPFRCDICNKGYIRRSDLTVHMRFHNKERSHQCGYCGKTFYQSGDLNRHIRQVHLRVKLLTCGHCQRRYSKESTLIHHMQTVHQDIILQSLGDKMADHVADLRVTLCSQNADQQATASSDASVSAGQIGKVIVAEEAAAKKISSDVSSPGSSTIPMVTSNAAKSNVDSDTKCDSSKCSASVSVNS